MIFPILIKEDSTYEQANQIHRDVACGLFIFE